MFNCVPLLPGNVADHREGLQINFRAHDRGPEIQHDTALKGFNGLSKDQKVAIAGRAERCPVAVGMLVNDVVAHADVNR